MVYLPELDGGDGIIDEAFYSANMWVPKRAVNNQETFIRAATTRTENSRTGDIKEIALARVHKNHLIVARHLFTKEEWEERISTWRKQPLELLWERVSFGDRIDPRDTAQKQAWEAFAKAENGVLNLACGKGKTVLALKKIAQRRVPAIVIVNNKGLMDQWKERRKLNESPNTIRPNAEMCS